MSENNSILIIGNGQSILENKFGNIIDQYPLVARINNYKIENYENKIGTRTDIWINGANSKLKKRIEYPNKILVFIPSQILKKKTNQKNYVSKRLQLDANKFEIVSLTSIESFEKKIQHNRLTTGMYSLLWAMENFENVTIHGFDFFINSKSHYYNSKLSSFFNQFILNKGYKHNNKKEKEFVENMIKIKKIKKLIDIV